MKIYKALILALAGAGLFFLAAPVNAQTRGHGHPGGHPGSGGHPGWVGHPGYYHHPYYHHGARVNVYFGGYYGYPGWGWGYPYWYAPYAYYYPYAAPYYYSYGSPQIYNGRVATNEGGKDASSRSDSSVTARVQRQLARGGYYEGSIDGIAGNGTREAIRQYQRDNGLRIDGRINSQLLSSMGLG